jgi:hypothetical protein
MRCLNHRCCRLISSFDRGLRAYQARNMARLCSRSASGSSGLVRRGCCAVCLPQVQPSGHGRLWPTLDALIFALVSSLCDRPRQVLPECRPQVHPGGHGFLECSAQVQPGSQRFDGIWNLLVSPGQPAIPGLLPRISGTADKMALPSSIPDLLSALLVRCALMGQIRRAGCRAERQVRASGPSRSGESGRSVAKFSRLRGGSRGRRQGRSRTGTPRTWRSAWTGGPR